MRSANLLRAGIGVVTALLLGSASVASAQNQPPPGYGPPPGYQQAPPPAYNQPPPVYQQPPPSYPPPAYPQPYPQQPGYYPPPPTMRPYRNGLMLGFGIGFGSLSARNCDDLCGGALGLQFNIGGMLNPRLALMFDTSINIHPIPDTDGTTSNSISAAAIQFWVTNALWLKGGLGVGRTQLSSESQGLIGDSTGFALLGAVGIEILQTTHFALDIQGRVGTVFHSDDDGGNMTNFAALFGFNWY